MLARPPFGSLASKRAEQLLARALLQFSAQRGSNPRYPPLRRSELTGAFATAGLPLHEGSGAEGPL